MIPRKGEKPLLRHGKVLVYFEGGKKDAESVRRKRKRAALRGNRLGEYPSERCPTLSRDQGFPDRGGKNNNSENSHFLNPFARRKKITLHGRRRRGKGGLLQVLERKNKTAGVLT